MKILIAAGAAMAIGLSSSAAGAQVPKCAADMTRPGPFCVDRYEASVWSIPPSAKSLIKRLQSGRATAADLAAGGAVQLGVGTADDYAPCADDGQSGCESVYAASIPGVRPSANLTWFQAQQACANSLKRLPRSGEWQQAVAGTPDPGTDDRVADCNIQTGVAVHTGLRSSCVSRFGNFDMVGNLYEWTEDWLPATANCTDWGSFSGDMNCVSGARTTALGPGAVQRGGAYFLGAYSGPFHVDAYSTPSWSDATTGFRCAR